MFKKHTRKLIIATAFFMIGCTQLSQGSKPELFLSLPEYANGPDAMTLAPNGDIVLACPNFVDSSYPGVILRVDKHNKFSIFATAPVHPDTGKGHPMGLDFANYTEEPDAGKAQVRFCEGHWSSLLII